MLLVEHKGMRSERALSYPKANTRPSGACHEQGQDDVRKKLDYGASITEESPERPPQVKQLCSMNIALRYIERDTAFIT